MPTRKTKGGGYKYGKTGKTYYGKGGQSKSRQTGKSNKSVTE